MQIVVGAVVLINVVLVVTGLVCGGRNVGPPGPGGPGGGALVTGAWQLLDSRSLWTAGVAGLGIELPSVDYLVALALIVASGAAAASQFGAIILFKWWRSDSWNPGRWRFRRPSAPTIWTG